MPKGLNRKVRGKFVPTPRIDLGLAIMQLTIPPGAKLKQGEIAAFCGCTRQRIQQIEAEALKKMHRAARESGLTLNQLA